MFADAVLSLFIWFTSCLRRQSGKPADDHLDGGAVSTAVGLFCYGAVSFGNSRLVLFKKPLGLAKGRQQRFFCLFDVLIQPGGNRNASVNVRLIVPIKQVM